MDKKGLFFALMTALVSGIAIFLNKFAVSGLNASAFAFAKNALVALFLISIILLLREIKTLKQLTKRNWLQLAAIGLVGGSTPFILFFNALQLTSAINAAFIHKTLFIWVSVGALVFLKEKINLRFIVGAALLIIGIVLLFGINITAFNGADFLVFLATLLWAAENIISKHVLRSLSSRTVAFGRMFFGSIFIAGFLTATNQLAPLHSVSLLNMQWIAISAVFLLMYVSFWYAGLKRLPASIATSILLLGLPVTSLLSFAFLGKTIAPLQGIGFLLLIAGISVIVGIGFYFSKLKQKNFSIAKNRT